MLINSVKRDYYDHLMGLGINREIVFSRYPKTTPVTNKDFLLYLKRHRKYDYFIHSYVRLIGFCGNVYKVIGHVDTINIYYSTEDYLNQECKGRKKSDYKATEDALNDYFSAPVHPYAWTLFEELKTPCFDVCYDSYYHYNLSVEEKESFPSEWMIKTGFLLKDIKFEKMFNPAQAFQEISVFLSNMAIPMKPIPELSNNDRILNAGFHLKNSFRKEKS